MGQKILKLRLCRSQERMSTSQDSWSKYLEPHCDRARAVWSMGTDAKRATTATTNLGLEPLPVNGTDEEKYWQSMKDAPNLKIFMSCIARRKEELEETPEWIVVPFSIPSVSF